MPESKCQNVFWWIASIAVSVLCCAVLFVLFACYLSDVKATVQNNEDRMALVQERQDRILSEIEVIRKHIQPDQPGESQAAAPAAPDTSVIGGMAPTSVVPTAPATTVTPSSPAAPSVVVPPNVAQPVPAITAPAVPSPSEKK